MASAILVDIVLTAKRKAEILKDKKIFSKKVLLFGLIGIIILLLVIALVFLFLKNPVLIEILQKFVDYVLHLDVYLGGWIQEYGIFTYGIVFIIIFCETGLVFFPFLPGDSLLFTVGGFAALDALNIWILLVLLSLAAVAGDSFNYYIGHLIGAKIYEKNYRFINRDYLDRAQNFFDKYGGKAIIIARFAPILRTFTPFVAGVSRMKYSKFLIYNVVGGLLWVAIFTLGGYFFGNLPFIKANFTFFILGIIIVSLIPSVVEFLKHWKSKK